MSGRTDRQGRYPWLVNAAALGLRQARPRLCSTALKGWHSKDRGRAPGGLLALSLLLLAACGHDGAQRYGNGAVTVAHFDQPCTFCHLSSDPELVTEDVQPSCRAAACHPVQQTHHDPQAGTEDACLVCHAPHQSSNLFLINEEIMRPDGSLVPVELTQIAGLADGGLASSTDPGTGLCETCHTETLYYRSDGTGAPHFTFTCFTCHSHSQSFVAQ